MTEFKTLDEMETELGLTLDPKLKRILSNSLGYIARKNGDELRKVRKWTKGANGKHQSYLVTEYPSHLTGSLERLCVAFECWEDNADHGDIML